MKRLARIVAAIWLGASAGAGAEEGFFRPSPDAALTRAPTVPDSVPAAQPSREAVPAPVAAELAVLQARQLAREAAEQELDLARREQALAVAEAARRRPPMIVSPLDGTAPIVSPLER